MDCKPPEIGRNKFDEWCWRRGVELREAAKSLDISIETVRRIRLPFSHKARRVPSAELAERIFAYTGGDVGPADFYPAHLRSGEPVTTGAGS